VPSVDDDESDVVVDLADLVVVEGDGLKLGEIEVIPAVDLPDLGGEE
jgi:hypothetical protein